MKSRDEKEEGMMKKKWRMSKEDRREGGKRKEKIKGGKGRKRNEGSGWKRRE